MIDLHCHILAGVDDGPRDMEESLEMARIYAAAGFTRVLATPHHVPGSGWLPQPAHILAATKALNTLIGKADIALRVFPGMEIALDASILSLIDEERILPLADSPYLLVEPPFKRLPAGWQQILEEIKARGYKVLLAHPERCAGLMRQPEIFKQLAASQIFLQANWSSLLGHHGPDAEALAWLLLSQGYVHCLATDGHDARFRHAGHVAFAADTVRKKIGASNLDRLIRRNPDRMLKGAPPEPIDLESTPSKPKKKRRWWW